MKYARLTSLLSCAAAALISITATHRAAATNSSTAENQFSRRSAEACADLDYGVFTKMTKKIVPPAIRYPNAEISELGEGWTLFDYTIDARGEPTNFRIVDGLGAPVFGQIAIEGISKARYEPAILDGKPADENISRLHVMFRIEGDNRVGVHSDVDMALERAYEMRKKGQFAESLARLREAYKGRLNLYEMTTLSFGMAASYRGMNDYRRALMHARHATIDNAQFADRGVQRPALELRAELEARDNNPADALCAYNTLMKRDRDFKPDATLQSLLDQATTQLKSATPVRTQVEIVETERTDVEPHWYHPLLRSHLRATNTQGKLKSYRLLCAAVKGEGPITDNTLDLQLDTDAQPCMIYLYGDPGTKFTVEETEDPTSR